LGKVAGQTVRHRSGKAVVALGNCRWGRQRFYVAPVRSLAYGAISLAIVIALAFFVDRMLGRLERSGWTDGEQWARHNKLVEENHRRKTTTNECELRQWNGQPLATDSALETTDRSTPQRTILVLGDSFVWGPSYITLNHLWWRQLAVELERRGYRDISIVAAGHPGWSTRRQLECAKELIAEVQPDLVIWGYVTNDPDERLVKQIFDAQDRPPYGQRIRQQLKRWLPNLTFKFESLRGEKLAAQYAGEQYGYAYADWELKILEGPNFDRYRETVAEVGELMRESKTPALLMTLPVWPCREYYEPRYAPVLKEWQASGIQVHNTLDEFIRRYGNAPEKGPEAIRWGINPADSHPGPRSTHFQAVMAADYIEANWPALLGSKDTTRPHELAINDWLPADLNVRPINGQTSELDYPATTDQMPKLLLGEPTAMVSLRYPLSIGEIRLEGASLSGGRIWISQLDPAEHYDEPTDKWHKLPEFSGSKFVYRLPADLAARELAEIYFSVHFQGSDRRLRLTLVPTGQTEERQP
jgi:hypothetical protein